MANGSVNPVGVGTSSTSSVSAGDVLRLVIEGASPGSGLDLAAGMLASEQRERLGALLCERGLVTDDEEEIVVQGRKEELAAVLARAAARAADARARAEATQRAQRERARDGTNESAATLAPDHHVAAVRLPAEAPDAEGSLAPAPAPTPSGGPSLKGGPCRDAGRLAEARLTLLALVGGLASAEAEGTAATARQGHDARRVLGETAPAVRLASGFPSRGHSGCADRVPLLQIAPAGLRATLEALGIRTLADLLARLQSPAGRRLVAELCGLSLATLLVVAHRAELLDLPVAAGKPTPHGNDVLLLARLGVHTVDDLARLGRLLEAKPERLVLLARLVSALQKAEPDLVGRQPLTRHELRAWAQAAGRRGSSLMVPTVAERGAAPAVGAELALASWLGRRHAGDESLWATVLTAALAWADAKVPSLEPALRDEASASRLEAHEAARLEDVRREGDRRAERLELASRDDARLEAARREKGVSDDTVEALSDSSPSLWRDPWPRAWLAPDGGQARVGFWVDPGPPGGVTGTGAAGQGALPAALRPSYVEIDPASGALVPVA